MIPQEIIRAKRDKNKLSSEEIKIFVDGIISGEFSDSQIAALINVS